MMLSEQKNRTKKLLLISQNTMISNEISTLLADNFGFFFAEDLTLGWSLLEKHYSEISAVLLESMLAAESGVDFITNVSAEPKFMFIPIVLLAAAVPQNVEIDCLSLGAVDIIMSPFHKKLTERRIENAIRLKDSASFHEIAHLMKVLPSNIFFKDIDCRYIFASRDWYQIEHDNDPCWTIRGKTDMDIRIDKENAISAMEADKEIIRTGNGASYIIKIGTDDDVQYFDIIKEPVRDKNDKICGIIGLMTNVTDKEKMRLKLKTAADTDGLTGLLNRRKIQSRIKKGLLVFKERGGERSLIMLDIDNFKLVNDTYGHNIGDKVLVALAGILRDEEVIGTEDFCAGRWGGEEFMLLLKNSSLVQAKEIAERIRIAFSSLEFLSIPSQTISLGVTQARQDDTVDTLCSRVDKALYMAKKSGKNRVEVI